MTDYGIKYHYDYTNDTVGDADQVQFVGKGSVTAWVQLDTGDLYVLGKVGIGYDPTTSGNTYKLYVNGTAYFNIGTSDNTSNLGFIIKGDGRYLSFGGAGVQAYDSSNAASTLYLNFNGGQSYIGGSTYAVGKVGIGYNPDTSGNNYKLYVDGTTYLNGNTTNAGHLYPDPTNTYDLGSDSLRWRDLYLKGQVNYIMHQDTSNYKTPISFRDTSNSQIAEIGFHNTGDTDGALILIPHTHSGTDSWAGSVGLYIGKTTFKWENNIILHEGNYRKHIFANKNRSRSTLTVSDSSWNVTSGTDVFGLAFKDTGLTYTPSGGSATASSDTGDWRAWLTCAANSNAVTLNMRIDGTWQASKFIGPLQGNADTATALTSNAGGTEQPIYFTGGKPSATSYALKATVNNSTAGYMAYYSGDRAVSGTSYARMIDGCLNLYPANSSYREGMRIHPLSGWSDITLMGNTNTNTSGIAATDWFIGNNSGTFYITHAGSSSSSTGYIKASTENSAGYWQLYQRVGVNGISNTYNFYVNGSSYFNGGVILKANQYFYDNVSGINANNSDIINLNCLQFGDVADTFREGIMFYRSAGVWECMAANSSGFFFRGGTDGTPALNAANANGTLFASVVWGEKTRICSNWIGFYKDAGNTTTRYGYIQANADRMYFRKENGVSTYAFDFNGYIYTNSNIYATGTMYADGTMYAHGIWANRASGERQVGVDAGTTGTLYFYSNGSTKGIYSSTGYRTGSVLTINSSSTTFYGALSGNASSASQLYVTGSSGTQYLTGVPAYETKNQTQYIYSPCYMNGGNLYAYNMNATAGYLKSTNNSNTVTIGSQNTGFCHITNSANIPFWFNKDIQIEQGKVIGGASTQYRPFQIYLGRNTTVGSNAINANNPLIEFSNSDRSQYCQLIYSDFDAIVGPDSLTLIGNQAGTHFIAPKINAGGYINNSYSMSTASFICQSWIRTTGSTGWYNESYGGGIFMQDDTWVRIYNNKKFYVANTAGDAINTSGGATISGTVSAGKIDIRPGTNNWAMQVGANQWGGTGILNGNGDGTGDGTGDLSIASWYGIIFQDGTNWATKAGINCRTGVYYGKGFSNTSSILVKENIKSLSEDKARQILLTRPVSFDYKKEFGGMKNQFGLIAEELEEILPELVQQPADEKGHKHITYTLIIPFLIKLAQSQQKEIDELKHQIKYLTN